MTRAILAIFLATLSPASYTYTHKPWTEELYQYLGRTYNANVEKRARYLQKMFLADESVTEHQMITDVNNFFNQVQWVSDSLHWGKKITGKRRLKH